ncbi:MAG: serine/threonine-protein kinase [Phycisphaerae bacterium]
MNSPIHPEKVTAATERRAIDAARRQLDALRHARAAHATTMLDAGEPTPTPEIPGYTLRREIHRGGQGVVYEAEQHGTRRTVAVKVIYEGARGAPAQRLRFERELTILASLRHPNIVALYEGGVAGGRLYCVMDYVDGRPLDAAAREMRVDEIVKLFIKVCEAVGVAHLRGVIHRDLKPANILVDAAGAPRVLDFGLAKLNEDDPLAGSQLTMTETGQFVGSLPWSSPEQADGRLDEIDTRTDVYALGVLLYQLLTGRFPYDVRGSATEVATRIRSATPLRPREALRRSSGASGDRTLDGEIETIVLKCLQKERDRRYQTAGELQRDLERYVRGEPIEAKRDSIGYMLRKTIRRNWVAASVTAAFLILIVGALVATTTLWRTAAAQQALAENESSRARIAEQNAERRRVEAEQRRSQSDAVASILEGLFGASPGLREFRGRDYTVMQMLDEHADDVLARLAGQPEAELRIRSTLAFTYRGLGELARARAHAERAVELARATQGEQSDDYGVALEDLAAVLGSHADGPERAEKLLRESLRIAESNGDAAHIRNARRRLAECLIARGADEEAEPLVAAADGDDDQVTRAAQLRLNGELAEQRGDLAGAEKAYREALSLYEASVGPRDHRCAMMRNDLALVLSDRGNPAAAKPMFEQVLAEYSRIFGPETPKSATVLSNLGLTCRALGEFDAAERHLRRSLAIRERILPATHVDVAAGLNNLAWFLEGRERFGESVELYRQALEILRQTAGESHPHYVMCLTSLARTLGRCGERSEAIDAYQRVVAAQRVKSRPVDLANSLAAMGLLQLEIGMPVEAEASLREALAIRQTALPAGHWLTANAMSTLGGALLEQGRLAEAEPLLLQSWETLSEAKEAQPERVRQAGERLVRLYAALGDAKQEAAWRAALDARLSANR